MVDLITGSIVGLAVLFVVWAVGMVTLGYIIVKIFKGEL